MMKPMVLFICLGNSCRSIMAEALTRHLCGERWTAASAGLAPLGRVMPETLEVLAELGVNTDDLRSKSLAEIDLSKCRLLINLTRRSLPRFVALPAAAGLIHRPMPDPYGGDITTYRRSRDAIHHLVLAELCWTEMPSP